MWVAISFSRGSSRPRDQTRVSHIVGRRFTVWATREVQGVAKRINDLHKTISSYCSNGINSEYAIKLLEYYVDFQLESAFLKDSSFKIEDEWRIVIFSRDYQFIESKYGIVARKLVKIPLSYLKEICLGPCSSEILKTSIYNWVKLINNVTGNEIKVTESKLTYRN